MPDILYRSAFDLAADIKAGTLSAVEVLEFFLARVEAHNPALNAVVALDADRARARAAAADAAAAKGEDWGPLHGVPMTIKDALCTEGLVTVGGIPDCKDNVPAANALAVQRYVDAGAIIFGKTNVPFMSQDLQSFNAVYGTSNNPWDTGRTCGGSSGGAAAALAAGLTPLELGSDIGGSIRTPSHFNGVFGHKPSYGIVSQRGHLPPGENVLSESDLSVVGPLGTNPADLEKALDVLVAPNPEDGKAWQLSLPDARTRDIANLRVAVWSDDAFCPVDTEIRDAIETAADSLERAGATVDRSARPDIDPVQNRVNYALGLSAAISGGMPAEVVTMMREFANTLAPDDSSHRGLQARGIALSHWEWSHIMETRQHIRRAWAAFFERYDVLLCPSVFCTAFPHNHEPDMHARTITVNGEKRPYLDLIDWSGLTLNALLPVTNVPIATSSEGLPIGVQVVADYLEDKTALAAAAMLEQHHRGFQPPPGYAE
ncbi:MAG: amidase [Halieaceae bacterium]|jgi:amidase|nr:amidase [Halieaceae bacterium]